MPRAITHYLFAMDCLKSLNKDTQNMIKNNLDMYILGSQGPNLFDYYNDLSFMNRKNMSKISYLVHNKEVNLFFNNMLMFCNNTSIEYLLNDSQFKDISLSYIYGFLSHYILDKTCHPYIYSLQKKIKSRYKYKTPFALHKSIETHIDKLILLEFKNLNTYEFHDYLDINLSSNELLVLCEMYMYLISSVYKKNISLTDIKKSYYTFVKVEKKINSYPSLFSRFYLYIKNGLSRKSYINNKIYFNYATCINDLININHSLWKDPFTSCNSEKSFIDLYNDGLLYYSNLGQEFDKYFNNKSTITSILLKINNASYFTNQNCDFINKS